MYRLGPALAAGLDDPLDLEIALRRRRRPDTDGFVGPAHMQPFRICIGIDCHGGDAHPLCRPNDPAGDLPAIGDQDFFEHVQTAARNCFVAALLAMTSVSSSSLRAKRGNLDELPRKLVTAGCCRAFSAGW